MSIESSSVIRFEPQPDFPNEDIHKNNAALAEYYLQVHSESEAYTYAHRETLQLLHSVGNSALTEAGIMPGNTRAEYQAFCHGFTTMDYLATLVDSRPFTQLHHGAAIQHFFMQHDQFADYELNRRRQAWLDDHENTVDILVGISERRGESAKQFVARAIGAQVAGELLYVRQSA